jgi:2OG-Fe(II) oxygenase superfamily
MEKLVYENDESLTSEFCDLIITTFENQVEEQYPGKIGEVSSNDTMVKEHIKNTTDITIPNSINDSSVWYKIHEKLLEELKCQLRSYYTKLDTSNETFQLNIVHKELSFDGFLITKYKADEGKFDYHNDFHKSKTKYRVLTFIWYLNDNFDCGETEFSLGFSIKPKKGKILIFPSEWCFAHRGVIPKTNDKYILTGWIYNIL